jgi:hypothetical protein
MKAEYDIRTMTLDDSEDIIDLVQESFKDAKTFYQFSLQKRQRTTSTN